MSAEKISLFLIPLHLKERKIYMEITRKKDWVFINGKTITKDFIVVKTRLFFENNYVHVNLCFMPEIDLNDLDIEVIVRSSIRFYKEYLYHSIKGSYKGIKWNMGSIYDDDVFEQKNVFLKEEIPSKIKEIIEKAQSFFKTEENLNNIAMLELNL